MLVCFTTVFLFASIIILLSSTNVDPESNNWFHSAGLLQQEELFQAIKKHYSG